MIGQDNVLFMRMKYRIVIGPAVDLLFENPQAVGFEQAGYFSAWFEL